MNKQKGQALAYLSEQHLRLKRSRHVELVLAEANAQGDADLLSKQDAVYAKYAPLLKQIEDEHAALSNTTTE